MSHPILEVEIVEGSCEDAIEYINAARLTWQRTRRRCAKFILERREKIQRILKRASEEGYKTGYEQGRRDALLTLTDRLNRIQCEYRAIEAAVQADTLSAVRTSVQTLLSVDASEIDIPLSGYIGQCLKRLPISPDVRIRVHPKYLKDIEVSGMAAKSDPSLSPEFIEVDFPTGTMRFFWFEDLFAVIQNRMKASPLTADESPCLPQ